jgi:hypothetical protein
MRALERLLTIALVCLLNLCLSGLAAAQQPDRVAAERVLGPQWKQISRTAGMIFAGTVLTTGAETVTTQTEATDRAVQSVQLSFRVDQPIAGVEQGQVLTIHEWTGAWAMHRPMVKGQHILLFLYPLSRLGLTSPVGGSLGQIAIDASGQKVTENKSVVETNARNASLALPTVRALAAGVSVVQLERAIRSAREE